MTTFTTQDRISATPFEEYCLDDKYVLRFYRVDHVLACTIDEQMAEELHKVVDEINHRLKKYELRNIAQRDRIAILEAQVYGGTTK